MANSVSRRKVITKRRAGFSKLVIGISVAAILVALLAAFSISSRTSNRVYASPKKYKATKPVVVDKQTGQRRMPNQGEIDEIVATLSTLANRPEDLPQTQGPNGGVVVDLEGGYGGVMLARPNEDLTWETKCVFTFAEGAEFLGLVEDDSTE